MDILKEKELYEIYARAYFEQAQNGNEEAYSMLCDLENRGCISLTEEEKKLCQTSIADQNNRTDRKIIDDSNEEELIQYGDAVVSPSTVTPAAVTPAAVTPATVTPAAVTPAAVSPAAVSPASAFSPYPEDSTDYCSAWERALTYMSSSVDIEKEMGISFLGKAIELAKQKDNTDEKIKSDICRMYLDLAHYYEALCSEDRVPASKLIAELLPKAFSNYVLAKEWDESNAIIQDDFLRFVYKFEGNRLRKPTDQSTVFIIDENYISSVEEEYSKSEHSANARYIVALHKIKKGYFNIAIDWLKYTLESTDIDDHPDISENSRLLLAAYRISDAGPFDDGLINLLLSNTDDTVLNILEEHRPHLMLAAISACSKPEDAMSVLTRSVSLFDRLDQERDSTINEVLEHLADLYCSRYGSLETAEKLYSIYKESDHAPYPYIAWLVYKYGYENESMRDTAAMCCLKAADHNIRTARTDLWVYFRNSTFYRDPEKFIIEKYEEYSKTSYKVRPVLAAYYLKQGDLKKAGEYFDSSDALSYLPYYIEYLKCINRYRDAARICSDIIDRGADGAFYDAYTCTYRVYSEFVYLKYAECLFALGDSGCISWYTKAAEHNDGFACACLALFYLNGRYVQKSLSTAEIMYQKAASLGYTLAYSSLAAVLYEEGKRTEAIDIYRKSIELNKNSNDLTRLALILKQADFSGFQSYENEWIDLLKEASECTPANAQAEFELGLYYYLKGEDSYRSAKFYLTHSLEKGFKKTSSSLMLADIYNTEGDPKTSVKLLSSCTNDGSEEYYQSQWLLAVLYLTRLDEKEKGFQTLNKLFETDIPHYFSLKTAECLLNNEYYEESKKWLKRSVNIAETKEDYSKIVDLTRQLIARRHMDDCDEDLLKICIEHVSQQSLLGELYTALANMTRHKKDKNLDDIRQADEYIEKAISFGYPKAMVIKAGDILSTSLPTSANLQRAEDLINDALRAGIDPGDSLVAVCKKKITVMRGMNTYASKAKDALTKVFERLNT